MLFQGDCLSRILLPGSLKVYNQVRGYLHSPSVSNGRGTNNHIPHILARLIMYDDVRNEDPLILTASIYQRTYEPDPRNHAQSDTTLCEANNNKRTILNLNLLNMENLFCQR